MRRITDLWFRLRALVARRSLERQVDEEFAFHIRMEAEHMMQRGWHEGDAITEARRRFGSDVRERERTRDAWGVRLGYDVAADVRHALRQMRRRPGFTALAVSTLGLGIGATLALFGVVHSLLLRPLPYGNADRLVALWSDYNWRGAEYDLVREGSLVFDDLAAYSGSAEPLRTSTDEVTQILEFAPATANLFLTLGTAPVLGRGFEPGEDRPGAEPVVVISHGLWQDAFGSSPDVIGTRVTIGGRQTTVIGVMPRGFFFPTPDIRAWLPLTLDPSSASYRGNGFLTLVGSVRDGASRAMVDQELARMTRLLGENFTYSDAWDKTRDAHVIPLREYIVGDVRKSLYLLLGAVSLLLLIACANAAALILARTTDRTTEMTVRVALGAGRSRIGRQVVTESVTLAGIAAAVGALIAMVGFQALVASLPIQQGLATTVSLGWQAFAVAFLLSVMVGVGVAIVPVRHVLRGRLDSRERSEEGLRRGTARAHAVLILSQVTVAVTLVSGAALLIRSVDRIRGLDPGFDATGVAALDLIAGSDASFREVQEQFYRDLLEDVRAIPGVVSAGLTNRLPVRDLGWQGTMMIEGRDDFAGRARPNSLIRTVTPDHLASLGIAIREGRGILDSDRADAPEVVLISEGFARRVWPNESAIGKRIIVAGQDGRWRTVVGVVEETRMTNMTGEIPFALYLPREQFPIGFAGQVLVIRATTGLDAVLTSARAIVSRLDSRVAVTRMTRMTDVVDRALAEPLRLRFFLALFAGLALLLGTVGVYGVVSYSVARRRAEFGIRMALGAAPRRVVAEVVRSGMLPVVMGVVAGLGASMALSGVIRSFLFEVSPVDPTSLMTSAAVLLVAGSLAVLVPGWRARGVSPVEALRSD